MVKLDFDETLFDDVSVPDCFFNLYDINWDFVSQFTILNVDQVIKFWKHINFYNLSANQHIDDEIAKYGMLHKKWSRERLKYNNSCLSEEFILEHIEYFNDITDILSYRNKPCTVDFLVNIPSSNMKMRKYYSYYDEKRFEQNKRNAILTFRDEITIEFVIKYFEKFDPEYIIDKYGIGFYLCNHSIEEDISYDTKKLLNKYKNEYIDAIFNYKYNDFTIDKLLGSSLEIEKKIEIVDTDLDNID